MPYTDEHKQTMKGVAALVPAFKEFEHDIMNKFSVALGHLHLLENPESETQAETIRARLHEAIIEAIKMFKELR